MKKSISMILAVLFLLRLLPGCGGKARVSACTPEDCEKLLALQFDGYRKMTVSEFRDRVWQMTDTEEYRALLERLFQDEALYRMRDSSEAASFLFYVLAPLTAENWQTRTYSGAAGSDFPPPSENAVLEYTYTLTVLEADAVTVRDYCDTRQGVEDALQDILRNRTREELRDEALMRTELRAYVDGMLSCLQTPQLSTAVEYAYFPLSPEDGEQQGAEWDGGVESRRYGNGTEEEYRSLLALKTPGYEELPLAEFNRALLEWADEDHERMERISEDIGWDDVPIALTDGERSFLKVTVSLSGMENGKAIQSRYAGETLEPSYGEELPQRTASEGGRAAWCSLYYQFSYSIADPGAVTVGQRDSRIEGAVKAARAFWQNTELERLLRMEERDVTAELQKIMAEHSTKEITITTDESRIHFERMDERMEREVF